MKLSEYIKQLQEFQKDNDDHLIVWFWGWYNK